MQSQMLRLTVEQRMLVRSKDVWIPTLHHDTLRLLYVMSVA
jgi:hypothetical protein